MPTDHRSNFIDVLKPQYHSPENVGYLDSYYLRQVPTGRMISDENSMPVAEMKYQRVRGTASPMNLVNPDFDILMFGRGLATAMRPTIKTLRVGGLSPKEATTHDAYKVFELRAKAKGYTTDASKVLDLTTEEGRKRADLLLYEWNKAGGGTETLEEVAAYYRPFYNEWVKKGPEGIAIEEVFAHVPTGASSYVKAHEASHLLGNPETPIGKALNYLLRFNKNHEFMVNNNSEIARRLELILNFKKVTGNLAFNGQWWKSAFEDYLKHDPVGNLMLELYRNIVDWDAIAKWASNPKNVRFAAPAVLMPKKATRK